MIVNSKKGSVDRNAVIIFGKVKHNEVIEFNMTGWAEDRRFSMPVFEVLISTPEAAVRRIQGLIEDFCAPAIIESVMEV